MGWKIKQLVEDVDTLYGSVQRRLVDEGTRSIDDRLLFASYHFVEAKRLLEDAIEARTDLSELLPLVLGGQRCERPDQRRVAGSSRFWSLNISD